MENMLAVRQYLGGTKVVGSPETEMDFVVMIRKGFPFSVFESLLHRAQLSEEAVCGSLRIAKRTAARRKQQAARLKPVQSELLLRLARVLAAAADVLGSEANAREWLISANRALDGTPPIKLLDTGIGFQQVLETLKRIEYGVYS